MIFKFDIFGLKSIEGLKIELPKRTRLALREAGGIFVEELNKATSRFSRSKNKWLKHDPYKLSGSFRLRSVSDGVLQVTSTVPYARVQDESIGGGDTTITSSNPMLIPFANTSMAKLRSLRAAKKSFFRNNILFEKVGKGLRGIAYISNSVTIPAKHYVEKSEIRATPRIQKMLEEMYKDM